MGDRLWRFVGRNDPHLFGVDPVVVVSQDDAEPRYVVPGDRWVRGCCFGGGVFAASPMISRSRSAARCRIAFEENSS